jgi:hypothetical protein
VGYRDGGRSRRFPGLPQPKALSLPFEPENKVTYIFGIGWRVRELRLEIRLSCMRLLLALYDPPWTFNVPQTRVFFKIIMVTVFMNLCTKLVGDARHRAPPRDRGHGKLPPCLPLRWVR